MLDVEHQMRTTLTLDDDVLEAAKVLAREAIRDAQQVQECAQVSERNGFPLLPIRPNGSPVDLQFVNDLRDD